MQYIKSNIFAQNMFDFIYYIRYTTFIFYSLKNYILFVIEDKYFRFSV